MNHLLSLCRVIAYGKMSDLSFCADLIKTNTAGVMLLSVVALAGAVADTNESQSSHELCL